MGLESIATNINGCNEIIIEGVNGTLIPPKDVNSLYNSMKQFLNQGKTSKNVSKTCRDLIEQRYDQEFIWKSILKEYQSLESR